MEPDEKLWKLVAQWRERAIESDMCSLVWHSCADDLEAGLRDRAEGEGPVRAGQGDALNQIDEEDDGYPYDDEEPYCHRCDNKGTIIVCIDDLCRGAGECMHGDGEIICPDCKGESGDF